MAQRLAVLASGIRVFTGKAGVSCFHKKSASAVQTGRCATDERSPKSARPTMTKRQADLDRNPFIPSRDPVVRLAEAALICSFAAACLAAGLICLCGQLSGTAR